MLGYLSVTSMVGGVNFIMYVPLVLHAAITASQIVQNPLHASSMYLTVLNLGFVKNLAQRVIPMHAKLNELKFDLEVYIGFYLIVVYFFGWSHFTGIILYWQTQRIRYMINYGLQHAYIRFDTKLNANLLSKPVCPAFVRTLYSTVKGMMQSMSAPPSAEQA